jgi:hypothetical protein
VGGFDNDRLMEVMKWRNEVIEEGKEARSVLGAKHDLVAIMSLFFRNQSICKSSSFRSVRCAPLSLNYLEVEGEIMTVRLCKYYVNQQPE